MNTPRILITAVAAAALGGAVAAASAHDLSASVDVVRSTVAGHAYQNGGVTKEDAADMQQRMKPYDLRLTFSEGKLNDYAADLRLRISDAAGKRVFGLDHAGPLTDVELPAGHYRVVADFGGVTRSGSVDVTPGQPASLFLHWPKDES